MAKRGFVSVSALTLLISMAVLAQEGAALKVGAPAPPLRAAVFAQPGRMLDLGALKGNVVVLEFWATWCGPCIAAIPHWNQLVDKFAGKPVTFVSIADDEEERLTKFLVSKPIKGTLIRDASGESFKTFGVAGRPHTIVVAADGKIAGITLPEDVTEQALETMLAGGAAQFPPKELKPDNLDWDLDEIDWKDGVAPELQVIIKPIRIAVSATRYVPGSNRLTADGVPLQVLVMMAYATDSFHLDWRAPRISGMYRVSATVPRGREAALLPLLQAAIAAQFGVRARWEDREQDVYVLRPIAGGKILQASPASQALYSMQRGQSHAVRQPMSRLVRDLTNIIGKPVVDESGLSGQYDWDLPYQPGQPEMTLNALAAFGLEAVPARRTVKILVVESASGSIPLNSDLR